MIDRRDLLRRTAALAAISATGVPMAALADDTPSNFRAIYLDPLLRDRFFLFLQNIFHLFPEGQFHQLILDLTRAYPDDEAIYRRLQDQLPGIQPLTQPITYALPALSKQKQVMTRQAQLLMEGVPQIDGYLEIGSVGRYVAPLTDRLPIRGRVLLLNDIAPTRSPTHMLERGGWAQAGEFIPLGNYNPVSDQVVPDESLDLVTNFIGFHHCPADRQAGFIDSLHRVLRPGGRLLVREHDVDDPAMDTFVGLAHDVFNAGVFLSWEDNAAQVRGFRSMEGWTRWIESHGFKRSSLALAQRHDPTDNVLMAFERV